MSSETQLQHHVEIGPDPHAAADVLASLIRSDQRDGKDLPEGLPSSTKYAEPDGPDRIPAPATVAREGAAACGALCRAEASKEKATHVGVCRATGPDGKPVHHAILVAAAKPGELPLVTDKATGKSIGPVDLKRIKDPSKDRGMNCGCHVPTELYQKASFSPIHPDDLHPDSPGGQAGSLIHAEPSERAAAGMSYQGLPRAHLPETDAGRAVAQVAALAARAVTPPPGHEPREAHELHPHPEHPHPEVDGHNGGRIHLPEHLEQMTAEIVGALHTIGGGKNPHPLPEDPPVTPAHAEAARSMIGTLVKSAKATPAHEHFDDPERQAQVLAVVPAHEQQKLKGQLLSAAAQLEHVDTQDPKKDLAVTVASELDALLPGVLPAEIGHSLRKRRANRQARRLLTEMIGVGYEHDGAGLASSIAMMVALDDFHVGCPWDGRRAPPPRHPHRPTPASDAPLAGGSVSQRAALDSTLKAALAAAQARDPETAFLDPAVVAAQNALNNFDKLHANDPVIGHGGGGGGHHGGFGGRGGFGMGGLDFLDCGESFLPGAMDPLLGRAQVEEFFVGSLPEVMAQVQNHHRAAEWTTAYGPRFWEHPEWQKRFWHRDGAHRNEGNHPQVRLEFRRGVNQGPERPRGWFGPHVDEQSQQLIVGQSRRGGNTWGGPQNGWVPTATWLAGHLSGGRFVPGPVDRPIGLACAHISKDHANDPNVAGWNGWNYRGHDRVIRDRRHVNALRRYWNDAAFRSLIDAGNVVDGVDLEALHEILDPPIGGWWNRMWGGRGREEIVVEEPAKRWWRRDRSWDRGWDWWSARLPQGHANREWFRRFHAEPDFRRRAEAGETIDGVALADVLAWARGAVPGSVPDVIVGAFPIKGGMIGGLGQGGAAYRPGYRPGGFQPGLSAPIIAPQGQIDQYGNTLDQYGNPIVGPGGGPIMGPYGPMQVGLHGIPQELLDQPVQECTVVAEGLRDARSAVRKGRPCPTGRCPNS
jgi:hypothetical protein